jgi:hypothetical protein
LVGIVITNINVIFHLVYLKLSDTLSDSDGEDGSSTAEEISKGIEHAQGLGRSSKGMRRRRRRSFDKTSYLMPYFTQFFAYCQRTSIQLTRHNILRSERPGVKSPQNSS